MAIDGIFGNFLGSLENLEPMVQTLEDTEELFSRAGEGDMGSRTHQDLRAFDYHFQEDSRKALQEFARAIKENREVNDLPNVEEFQQRENLTPKNILAEAKLFLETVRRIVSDDNGETWKKSVVDNFSKTLDIFLARIKNLSNFYNQLKRLSVEN